MSGPAPLGGSYQAWADHLERWSKGEPVDGAGLPPLAPADFPADTLERLQVRITDALDRRLQRWADALVAAMNAADDEFAAGRALAQARGGLHQARSLAAHPGLPAELRERLSGILDDTARRIQQDLENDLVRLAAQGADPRFVEARRRTLRDNPLTAVIAQTPPADPGGWSYDPTAVPRRRIITD
ncbi:MULTISPECIES: hypothetical protein [Kitasatospora]|uniref:Uncharacterized protein n=1 Tax=Kitasatospora cystarginea TaxID=58350 RepID=A0ABN3DYV9_9ACTN